MKMDQCTETYLRNRLQEYVHLIPPHMVGGLERYLFNGIPPGSFLAAVLTNNLKNAFNNADSTNAAAMGDWMRVMVNFMPSNTWGSVENYRAHLDSFNAENFCEESGGD